MARYWIYVNNQVVGPFPVEQLVRMRDFSRQTLVCVDDHSGKAEKWIPTEEIPELAAIFRAADELRENPAPKPPKPAPKAPPVRPVPVRVPRPVAEPAVAPAPRKKSSAWPIVLSLLAATAVAGAWYVHHRKSIRTQDEGMARQLVEGVTIPGSQGTFGRYLEEKANAPRWEYEHTPAGLLNTSVSWFGEGKTAGLSTVCAFEVNLQAQSVRPLNSTAARLVSEGPANPKPATREPAAKRKSEAQKFTESLDARRKSFEAGEFSSVWKAFSPRKRSAMVQAGMSESGFIRLQTLTRGLEPSVRQSVLKTHKEDDGSMLVLLRQTQEKHTDLFLKQHWVLEEGSWLLDEEEKRPASDSVSSRSEGESAATASEAAPATVPKTNIPVMKLPGLSN